MHISDVYANITSWVTRAMFTASVHARAVNMARVNQPLETQLYTPGVNDSMST